MHTYAKTCIICPHCEKHTSASIDHLEAGTPFGPWYCDSCGGGYRGVAHGTATTLIKTACRHTPTLDLLVLPPSAEPVYFIIEGTQYHDPARPTESHKPYYYEEGSCPTNWIGSTRMISHGGDTDPHGFLKFLRTIPSPGLPDDPMGRGRTSHHSFPRGITP